MCQYEHSSLRFLMPVRSCWTGLKTSTPPHQMRLIFKPPRKENLGGIVIRILSLSRRNLPLI